MQEDALCGGRLECACACVCAHLCAKVLTLNASHALFEHHLLSYGNQTTVAIFGKAWWFTLDTNRVLFSPALMEGYCKVKPKKELYIWE